MKGRLEFGERLNRLIARVEAWNYADTDAGAGLPVEVARELKALAASTESPGLKLGVRRAQDALDDGLSAEAVAAALYRVRAELDAQGTQGVSPPAPPSPSR